MSTREIKKTEAGQEYQIDLLSKEYTRLKKNLTRQIGSFDEVIRTTDGNTATVKQGLDKLWEIYTELCSTSTRLCELVSEDKATQIRETV